MNENVNSLLANIKGSLIFFLPEATLFALLICIIVIGLIFPKKQYFIIPVLVLSTLPIVFILSFCQMQWAGQSLFVGVLFLSGKAIFFKLLFTVCCFLTVLFSLLNSQLRKSGHELEYYTMIIAVVLGSHLLAMASNFIMAFLAFEIISIGSYILTTIVFNRKTAEAAVKYILFGMFSSGIMVYGLSFLYGLTGTLDFNTPQFIERLSKAPALPVLLGFLFTIVGVFFKISAFPFQIWVPDVYEATPAPLVAFFSTITKAAGFAFLLNLLPAFYGFPFSDYFPHFSSPMLIALVSILTISIGNVGALFQENAKRMLGYSAIAQSGFILLPLVALSPVSQDAVLFYLAVYVFMSFAVFFMVEKVATQTQSDLISAFKGLGLKSVTWGVLIIIVMVSLIGLPPTGGFVAKFVGFTALWEAYSLHPSALLLILFTVGILNAAVALFYYIKIPFFMFFKEASPSHPLSFSVWEYAFAAALSIILLVLFFKADYFISFLHLFTS